MDKEAEIKETARALQELFEADLYAFKYIKGFADGALQQKNQEVLTKGQNSA